MGIRYESYKKKVEIKDLVDTNCEYYTPVFAKFEESGRQSVFSPAALLLTPFWCIYRRMVTYGACIIGLQIILAMIAYVLKSPLFAVLYVASFAIYVYFGFYGNYIYYKRLLKLQKMGDEIDVKYRHKFMNDKKGVDITVTVCWVIGTVVLYAVALFT